MATFLGRSMIFGVRALTGAQARWVGCAPVTTQRIYFANHTSHCDFLLVLATLAPSMRPCPVAAMDYWETNSVRRYLAHKVFRAILIDRCHGCLRENPLQSVTAALSGGNSILFFPEGTRGSGDQLGTLKSGIFHLASANPGVELVPVWIDNASRIMPKGCILPIPLLCSVTFGEPVRLAGDDKHEFLKRLHGSLAALAPRHA